MGTSATPGRVLPYKKMAGWFGGTKKTERKRIITIIDRIDEDNMPESIIVVAGTVTGYSAYNDNGGGSYVYLHHPKPFSDGRFKRDPVWCWYYSNEDGADPYTPFKGKAWTWKTLWGRDIRWVKHEIKKFWPDGFPGYDHSHDPFHDDCDEHKALKAPEW